MACVCEVIYEYLSYCQKLEVLAISVKCTLYTIAIAIASSIAVKCSCRIRERYRALRYYLKLYTWG